VSSSKHLRAILLGLVSLVLGLSLAAFLISALFVLSKFEGTAHGEIPKGENACALVFGSAIKKAGEPGPAIVRRVAAAVDLYEEGNVGTLIMSGGRGKGIAMSEASVMGSVARDAGVEAGDIVLEEKATSTLENIKFAQSVIRSQCTFVLGVSDRYHLARIELLAWRLDVPLRTYSAGGPENPLLEMKDIVREAMAIVYYVPYIVWRL
jgi:vancomycin permeability regulator SanA